MATAPVAATGVTTQAAGASGVLTGDVTGLAGLFAALLGGAGQVTGAGGFSFMTPGVAGTDVATDATNPLLTLDLSNLTALQGGLVQQDVQLGDDEPAVTVSGTPDAVASFMAQVKTFYQQLAQNGVTMGKSMDTKELTAALTKMGLAPDAAAGVAERIQTMLKLVEQQQGKVDDLAKDDGTDGSAEGTLAAMMLAVMAQQMPQAQDATAAATDSTLSVQITTVAQTVITVNVKSAFKNTDFARDMMGLNAGGAKVDAGQAAKGQKIEVAVSQGADDPSITVTLPEVGKDDGIPAANVLVKDVHVTQAAQAAAVTSNPMTGTQVAARDVIKSPEGETLYKLQADKNGVETVEAVKPAGEKETLPEHKEAAGRSEFQQMMMDAVKTTQTTDYMANQQVQQDAHKADMASFADRVQQVNDMIDKAKVGQQVAVQVQPLLEQGGGTIKINLHPKELGHITVELSVHEGKVQGSIAASEPAVVEQLARELHGLRHGLAEAGLKLGENGINLMLSNQGGQQGQGNQSGQQPGTGNRGTAGGFAGTETDGVQNAAQNLAGWVSPDRVLDVNV